MNVKEHQAGQRGICPVCGTRMRIPFESTRPSSGRKRKASSPDEPASGAIATDDAIEQVPPDAATAALPAAYPSTAATFAPTPPVLPGEPANELAAADSVIWYVRPPSGGQFGPATTDILRAWVAEGRLSAETLVWREGWRDWRPAGGVFPQLSAAPASPALEIVVPGPSPVVSHARPARSHVPPRKIQAIALGGLAGLVLILLIALLVVWLKQ